MRKIVLFTLALIVNFNVFAATNNLADSITKSLNNKPSHPQQQSKNPSIYYGGKDISHPLVAQNTQKKKQHIVLA